MTRFDRAALTLIAALIVGIAVVVLLGDHAGIGITVSPADGDNPSANTSIRIAFNQPMDIASVESRFSIQPKVDGQITWDGNTLVFKPKTPLSAGQAYTAQLQTGAASKLGRQTTRLLKWTFRTRQPGVLYLSLTKTQTDTLWWSALDGTGTRQVYSAPDGIDGYAVSPDGGRVALAVVDDKQGADVWLIDPSGRNPTRITNCSPGYCSQPAWLPDGSGVAYIAQDSTPIGVVPSGRIWVYDLAGKQASPMFQNATVRAADITWSPDGGHAAFFDPTGPGFRILDMNSGQGSFIPSQMGEMGSFSPDGLALTYADYRPVGGQFYPEVWLAQLGGEHGIAPLVDPPEEDRFPSWSPDNHWIAFSRRLLNRTQGLAFQFMLYNVQSHELRQVTHDSNYNDVDYEWGPSGDVVIVQRQQLDAEPPGPQLWLYTLKTSQMTRIVSGGLDPRWLP